MKEHTRVPKKEQNVQNLFPSCSGQCERREPTTFEVTQHASLTSWQTWSIDKWQLGATRPTSQSSRKRVITSLDQFCPTTSRARKRRRSHILPSHRHRYSTQGFLGSHTSHMSPNSGEESLFDRRAFSSAIVCKPIKAHAFTASAEMQGPPPSVDFAARLLAIQLLVDASRFGDEPPSEAAARVFSAKSPAPVSYTDRSVNIETVDTISAPVPKSIEKSRCTIPGTVTMFGPSLA